LARSCADADYQEIRRIGEQLYANGGHKRMLLVHYRVLAIGGITCSVEPSWNGIGNWRS
jgi:hypothetical protein